jgi:hypothetical protein
MLEQLNKCPVITLEKWFPEDKVIKFTEFLNKNWQFRPAPGFLGNFNYSMKKSFVGLPIEVLGVLAKLQGLVPKQEQVFNTLFIQKYDVGQEVKLHQDPMNNIGCTIIAYFGDWTGGMFNCEGANYITGPGDVVIMRCNYNNLPRPKHKVSPIISGTKYSFILNTII